jgi:AraC family cel operon transcriptional repressor
LILLRRTDIHELVCENDSPCLYYLVSFTNKVFNNIKKRYFPTKQDMWGENNPIPRKYKIPKMLQEWLNAAVQDLVGNPDDSLALDRFLINLVFEIRRIEEEPYYACPEWLSDALERSREPQFFDSGPRILSEISGRTYEHVSRVLKASTGMSPSKFFNRVRVEYAATKLILTDEPIAGIANDCGFSNLGRFYILFKERFNMPPRKYRLRYRTVIPA